jgi:hypothetical protein
MSFDARQSCPCGGLRRSRQKRTTAWCKALNEQPKRRLCGGSLAAVAAVLGNPRKIRVRWFCGGLRSCPPIPPIALAGAFGERRRAICVQLAVKEMAFHQRSLPAAFLVRRR